MHFVTNMHPLQFSPGGSNYHITRQDGQLEGLTFCLSHYFAGTPDVNPWTYAPLPTQ